VVYRGAFDFEAVLLTRNPRKFLRHLHAANAPSAIGGAAKKLATATAELQHITRLAEHRFRKGR
jgi:hypothetical protein